jgi:hypothetical protein
MLEELKQLLSMFRTTTDELQTNKVSISHLYPNVMTLLVRLNRDLDEYTYTKEMRMGLANSLKKRYIDNNLLDNEISFKIATFLDPYFNISTFNSTDRYSVINKVKSFLRNSDTETYSQPNEEIENCKRLRYETYDYEYIETESSTTNLDIIINEYIQTARNSDLSALDFWKTYETRFPALSNLARKYLSIQASSAAVERMFSIAGHIHSLRRRRLGSVFFSDLVFLKLNENLL